MHVVESHTPTVLVTDALDECHPSSDASDILALLAVQIYRIRFPFKVFITSRPERHILARFDKHLRNKISEALVLHDVELSIVQADIRLVLPQSGSEPKFEPELLRTGPKFGPKFVRETEPDLRSSLRFRKGQQNANPFERVRTTGTELEHEQ
jgi:hypothetical protein